MTGDICGDLLCHDPEASSCGEQRGGWTAPSGWEHAHQKTKELCLCQYQTVFSKMLFCFFTEQKGKCGEYVGRSISWLHLTSDSNYKGGCLIWEVIKLTQFYCKCWCWEQRMPFSCLCKWLASHCLLQIIIPLCRVYTLVIITMCTDLCIKF